MKKLLFYTLLLFQILVVLLVVLQYNLIDTYGENRTFLTDPYVIEDELYDEFYQEENISDYEMYGFEFTINKIPKDKWEGKEILDYREKVYVLIQENKAGIYEVIKASDKKITTNKENEAVLIGTDIYEVEDENYYVNYGFETINVNNHKKLFKDYDVKKEYKVTFKIAPWNQGKLIKIN